MKRSRLKQRITALSRPALALALLLGVTACETPQTSDNAHYTPYPPKVQERLLPTLEYWQAEGKISFQVGDERQSATFDWQQHKDNYDIHIFGAFGYGSTRLKRAGSTVTLESAEFGDYSAATAEQLMQQLVGWQVPLSDMQYWIKGAPSPQGQTAEVEYNTLGLLAELQQQGWHVAFERYAQVRNWQLPHKIVATRDDLKLVAVVKNWEIKNSSIWN